MVIGGQLGDSGVRVLQITNVDEVSSVAAAPVCTGTCSIGQRSTAVLLQLECSKLVRQPQDVHA
jgi:hypothetical protein